MTSQEKCVTHAQATLETMKQRAKQEWKIVKGEEGVTTYVYRQAKLAKIVTQTYRDTLNIALAGIVDREDKGQYGIVVNTEETIGFNQANAKQRAFLQGLLDDIKD